MSEHLEVVAFDPGGTTGFAWYAREAGQGHADAHIAYGEIPNGRSSAYDFINDIITSEGSPVIGINGDVWHYHPRVVCEDFIINTATATKSRQSDPLRIAGYLEGKCAEYGHPFKLQTPAQAKAFATDDKLRHLGWYHSTPGGHANDAARHLLTYLCIETKDPEILALLAELLED